MGKILIKLAEGAIASEGSLASVRVFDSSSAKILEQAVVLSVDGFELDSTFATGSLLVRLALSTGEQLAETIFIRESVFAEVVFNPRPLGIIASRDPWYESIERRIEFEGLRHRLNRASLSVVKDLELWRLDQGRWTKEDETKQPPISVLRFHYGGEDADRPSRWKEGVFLELDLVLHFTRQRERSLQPMLMELVGSRGSTFCVVPPLKDVRILIFSTLSLNGQPVAKMDVLLPPHSGEELLAYLTVGDFASAKIIGARSLPYLLQDEPDPLSSAIAGYFLLLAADSSIASEWERRLPDRHEGLADQQVIVAYRLLRSPQPDISRIRLLLLNATRQGLPQVSIGVRLLYQGLKLLAQLATDDPEVDLALETVGKYLNASEAAYRFLTFTGSGPDRPLPSIDDNFEVTDLLTDLWDQNESTRVEAVRTLSEMPTPSVEVVLALEKAIWDPSAVVRDYAILALRSYPILLSILSDAFLFGDRWIRASAAWGLRMFGEDTTIPILMQALSDEADEEKQLGAVSEIARMAPAGRGALEWLETALFHQSKAVRKNSAFALGRFGDLAIGTVQTLIGAFSGEDKDVAEVLVDAIEQLGPGAVPALVLNLENEDADVRTGSARTLAKLGPRAYAAVRVLIRALDDPERKVRIQAAVALGRIGPDAFLALPRLFAALDESDEEMKAAARIAIWQIEPDSLVGVGMAPRTRR